MSDPVTFVSKETVASPEKSSGVFSLNFRLFRALPHFRRLFPLTFLFILFASASPSFFRWYSGKLAAGEYFARLPFPSLPIYFSTSGLMWLTVFAVGCRIAAWGFFEVSGMWSSYLLHEQMVKGLSRTRTTFFDENPSGRLINRLIRDFDEVRSTAIIFAGDFLNAIIEVLSVAILALIVNPYAALCILPLLACFFYIQSERSAMLDHSRTLSAMTTSQVLGRKNDLVEGRAIFTLFGSSEKLLRRLSFSFREYVKASAMTSQIETWASFWMRASAEGFSFMVLLFLVYAIAHGQVTQTLAGVIISALFGITGSIGWLDFATSLISRSAPHIRRVFEFVDLVPEETVEGLPEMHGSDQSCIEFVNYTMSYRKETPTILSALNLRLELGKKTALVGRTGSGKSSLVQALLRMVYVHGGNLSIDGRSVFSEEIRTHRRRFGVVPQTPYLFQGSLRENVDRNQEMDDELILDTLKKAGLNYPLQFQVSEGGSNLSLGERQLICLVRVIAANKEIILMDEPTSGLDPETDARMSRLLFEVLKNKTVLTIAHRLETLARYDQIIELKQGKVHWQGRPEDYATSH